MANWHLVHCISNLFSFDFTQNCTQSSSAIRTEALKIANQFALEGLRTLVFGTRQLNRAQYENLLVELRRTEGLVGEQRVQGMKQIYSRIESDLVPCAVTGVEDKLQIGVKECVQSLRESGIQVSGWFNRFSLVLLSHWWSSRVNCCPFEFSGSELVGLEIIAKLSVEEDKMRSGEHFALDCICNSNVKKELQTWRT